MGILIVFIYFGMHWAPMALSVWIVHLLYRKRPERDVWIPLALSPITYILIVGIVSLAVRRGIGNIFFVDPIVIAFFESLGVATILVFEQSRAIRHDLIALATFSSNVGAIGLTLALVSPTEM